MDFPRKIFRTYHGAFVPCYISAELTHFGTGFRFYNILKDCIWHRPTGKVSIVRGAIFRKFIGCVPRLILLDIGSLINYILLPHHTIQ